MNIRIPSLPKFSRDTKLLISVSGIFAISFHGVQMLLRVLYVIRLGHGPEYVGLFNAAGALTYMGMSLPSGALGSRFGARKIMLIGSFITTIGMASLPLAEFVPTWLQNSWPIMSQMTRTMGWSMFNVNMVPILMATTTAQSRNSAYALNSALRGLGTFLGTVSGGMLPGLFAHILSQSPDETGPYRLSLWLAAFLGLIAIVPLFLVRTAGDGFTREKGEIHGRFPILPIAPMILYAYLSHSGWSAAQSFGNAYMDTDLCLSASSIGLITGVGQFATILAPLIAPRLAACRSNGWTLTTTAFGMAISLLPLALIPNWAAAGIGRLGVLALSSIWMPALQVYQMEQVESSWRSLAYGATSMAMGFSFGSISLAGGYIIAAAGYRSLFLLVAVMTGLSGALMWFIYSRQRSSLASSPVSPTDE